MNLYKGEVFVTKYALTKGVFRISGEERESNGRRYFWQEQRGLGRPGMMLARGDYALTDEEAVVQVAAFRDAAIKAAEKKLAKLRAKDPRAMVAAVK